MINEDIVNIVRDYVLELLSNKLQNDICFHNVTHTQEVVKAAIEIAGECRFNPKQLEIVMLAAWFHDCGYTTTYTLHEDSSKTIAVDFLNRNNYPKEDIEQVLACIEATRFPKNPTSPEEEVLADADLYHFIKPDYPKYEQQLRKEFKTYLGRTYTDMEWAEINYTLLKSHSYYTDYGKNVLQQFKEVNIERLKTTLTK
ncbi:MAG: HD domain-containing protein [Daejeonella sp.]|uniref:HD domain-containing protein n=1 Tax=Daejeonella sp. TaxID=2805397 RepID=UPI0027372C5C|nr:HD domain-containing protein [Daejeonella sp.]MDP3470091.1 HD domain-containing protein [Daejeonella sp.]